MLKIEYFCTQIHTIMAQKDESLARAHWWGFAAIPDEMEYPFNGAENPLTLVCQFPADEGMVYVFADLEYFFGDLEADGGHLGAWDERFYKVLYAPSRENLHEHEIRYADGSSGVPEPVYENVPEWNKPRPAQCFTDEVEQDWPGYEVLVELEENDDIDLRFYDCGELFFLIRPEDRAAKRFDRVACALYSY